MLRSAIAVVIALTFQQQTPSSSSPARQDVYAIYSLMMSNPPTSYGPELQRNRNQVYAIAATTRPPMTRSTSTRPYPCLVPPQSYASRWNEVLADFSARSNTPATLERALTISKPYVLLDANDTQNAITTDNRNVPGAADLFILSDVYFNRDRTLALTGIYSRCGGRCAVGEWKMFEKLPTGSWAEVLPDSNCKVMS